MRVTTLAEALRRAAQRGAKTLVLDVEPVVAYWDSGQQALDQGVRQALAQAGAVPGVAVVCFATNSARHPSASLACPGVRVEYLTSAGKPFRLAPYQGFPAPGVVIGDQPLTDGLLAGRLGYAFVHCTPDVARVPRGPWLLGQAGRLVRPLLDRPPDG
ncbi:MAG TPA: hypothetical protein VMI33_23525 [Streptosporangiaceae bacterium]|nr:hypothetical protein [Streptosporangiaceae bacterium]